MKGIIINGGVIDPDFRGEINVIVYNATGEILYIRKHEKIAQMVLLNYSTPEIRVVTSLNETIRGSGCFGSSGRFETSDYVWQFQQKAIKAAGEQVKKEGEKKDKENESSSGIQPAKRFKEVRGILVKETIAKMRPMMSEVKMKKEDDSVGDKGKKKEESSEESLSTLSSLTTSSSSSSDED